MQDALNGVYRWDCLPERMGPEIVGAEMADVQVVLWAMAHRRGADLQAEVDAKMAVNRAREWVSRGDGTGWHVKESVV